MTTKKQTKTEIVEDYKKIIDDFAMSVRKGLDSDGDKTFIEVTFNESLRNVLKTICLAEPTDFTYPMGQDDDGESESKTIKRYLVKRVPLGAIYSEQKQFLFLKKLLDTGKENIYFNTDRELSRVMNGLKDALQRALSVVLSYDITQTITFKRGADL